MCVDDIRIGEVLKQILVKYLVILIHNRGSTIKPRSPEYDYEDLFILIIIQYCIMAVLLVANTATVAEPGGGKGAMPPPPLACKK